VSSPLRYNLYRANVVAHAVSTGTLFITIEIEIFKSTSFIFSCNLQQIRATLLTLQSLPNRIVSTLRMNKP
jgi:hypothetical protein